MPHDQSRPPVTHAMADIEPGLRLHFVTAGTGERTAVLLHGFPQTWWEWHHMIAPLVDAGFRVVTPDYRGAGHSSRPAGGYDKRGMAKDIHGLLREHLQITGPVVMIGHDIGLMVAYAYAQAYRGEVSHLAVIDAPLPGTDVFDRLRSDPRVWQFAFFTARATSRKCWSRGVSVNIYGPFSTHEYSIRPGSPQTISTFMSLPIPRRERCARASNSIALSTRTSRTTGRPCNT